jgi:DNA polymerase-3 subunit gamma/tau
MGKALYRAYRSMSLSEIVGQEHITSALARALEHGAISHAYLFTGPRGVGKTSIARILAHAVNGLPYAAEGQHLDIIEIDAASNNGVEDVRDLRDKVHTAPTSSKYKVYIIDEVHMLSRAAFNALLKTLEEPPEHVIFILATTELHKVPETIVSRTQQYTFRPVEQGKVTAHLREIADKEKLQIDDEALQLIAEHGGGSFRDSISLLDQARHAGEQITAEQVEQLLGRAPQDLVQRVIAAVASQDIAELVSLLDELRDRGLAPDQFATQLMGLLRTSLRDSAPLLPAAQLLALLEGLSKVAGAHDPRTSLEVRLLEQIAGNAPAAVIPTPTPTPPTPKPTPPTPRPVAAHKPAPKPAESASEPEAQASLVAPSGDYTMTQGQWLDVLGKIRGEYGTLYGTLKLASPQFQPGKLTLLYARQFGVRTTSEATNKDRILKAIGDVCGVSIAMEAMVGEAATAPAPETPAPKPTEPSTPPASLANISNIFGSAEVLDS